MVLISKELVFITKDIKVICLRIPKEKEERMGATEDEKGEKKSVKTHHTRPHKPSVKQPVFLLHEHPQGLQVFTCV